MKKNDQLRLIVSIVFAVLFILASVYLAKKIISSKKQTEVAVTPMVKSVFVDTVVNDNITLQINATGRLEAYQKVELYAEVQGILENTGQLFKAGKKYNEGSILLSINDTEYNASLVAQRSSFYKQIASMLPDLQLDYPNAFVNWQEYLSNLEINRPLPLLPETTSSQEKYFVSNQNIYNTYYTIKNMEERLNKYQIRAPFNGVVTEALVSTGTLIRAGQKLGEFIDPSLYELAVALNESNKDVVNVGNSVKLSTLDNSESFYGKISRINEVIDPNTQSVEVFITVSSQKLNEGMFLNAEIAAQKVANAVEIPRELLIDNSKLFIVQDKKLKLVSVEIIHFTEKTAVIKGLEDGTFLLDKNIPGAYDGMLVEFAK